MAGQEGDPKLEIINNFIASISDEIDKMVNTLHDQIYGVVMSAAQQADKNIQDFMQKSAAQPMQATQPMQANQPMRGMPQQSYSSNYPNKRLPWFKHGLRGFLRKLWYGNRFPDQQSNGNWSEGVSLKEYVEISDDAHIVCNYVINEFENNMPSNMFGTDLLKGMLNQFKDDLKKLVITRVRDELIPRIRSKKKRQQLGVPPTSDVPTQVQQPEPVATEPPKATPQVATPPTNTPQDIEAGVTQRLDKVTGKRGRKPKVVVSGLQKPESMPNEQWNSLKPAIESKENEIKEFIRGGKIRSKEVQKARLLMKSLQLDPNNFNDVALVFGWKGLKPENSHMLSDPFTFGKENRAFFLGMKYKDELASMLSPDRKNIDKEKLNNFLNRWELGDKSGTVEKDIVMKLLSDLEPSDELIKNIFSPTINDIEAAQSSTPSVAAEPNTWKPSGDIEPLI